MLIQKPYHHPYIPTSPPLDVEQPPYIGGELANLTSMTPFLRGQGVPLYEPCPPCPPIQAVRYGATNDATTVTGTDGWATYTWNKGTNTITYKSPSDGKMVTVKSGTSAYTNITTKVKDWKPVSGGKQTGDKKDKFDLSKLGAGLTSAVDSFFQTQQGFVPEEGGTAIITQDTTQQGMSTGLKVGLAVGGVAVLGLIIALVAKD
mgnify:CR=1 FL=1